VTEELLGAAARLGDEVGAAVHVLCPDPGDAAPWGANLPNSPLMAVNYWCMSPDAYPQLKSYPPLSVFLLGADKWSDGTPAAPHM